MAKKKTSRKNTAAEYEKLGRALELVFASEYITRSKLYWISFSRGIFFGLGVTVGGTILLALIIWILSLFTEIPLIGEFAEKVTNTIDNN